MKNTISIFLTVTALGLLSCGNGKTDFTDNAASMIALGEEIKGEFGDSYYTSFSVNNTSSGPIVGVSTTKDPSSMQMGDWQYFDGSWSQISEITLEVPSGAKAEDYMFKFGEQVKFETIGKIIEDAKATLKKEKEVDAKVEDLIVNAPNNGDFDTMEYLLTLEPISGGTSFNFSYTLNGELIKYDY